MIALVTVCFGMFLRSQVAWRSLRSLFVCTVLLALMPRAKGQDFPIHEVWIVPLSHTDFGYTDQPSITRDLHRRYIDIALDAALKTRNSPIAERFHWTIESQYSLEDWWKSASERRRNEFIAMIKSGQLDVSALADDNTPYMDYAEWEQMTHWIPDEVWRSVQPQTGIQDDVNGFPRAGAMLLLDRGIHRLWTGINNDLGGAPMPASSAFWWRMPDGRRMFVWVGIPYSEGYSYFHPTGWRRGPLPKAGDPLYRPPTPNELLPVDDVSLRTQHSFLLTKLHQQVVRGYHYPVFILPFTNQWRIDNDPPYSSITEFVAAWNRAGLSPRLRLATATEATTKMEEIAGRDIPEYSGEFTDWWADGSMSAPIAISASRVAKRYLQEAASPLFGPMPSNAEKKVTQLQRELVVFDEHSWGSGMSIALPYSLDTQGQFAEKSLHAYGAMAQAQWLLGQRARTAFGNKGAGLYVINTTLAPWSGWVSFPASALRSEYESATDATTGVCRTIEFYSGMKPFTNPEKPDDVTPQNDSQTFADNLPKQVASIWVQDLKGNAFRRLLLSSSPCAVSEQRAARPSVEIQVDANNWPTSLRWPGMPSSLILPGLGDFSSVEITGFAPRANVHKIWNTSVAKQRNEERESIFRTIFASKEGSAVEQDNGETIIYTQSLKHPSLGWAVRRLEIWKSEPRIKLDFKLYRKSSELPEVFFISFPLPVGNSAPAVSNGGISYKPYQEQIPGSCKDYFAIDGWVDYETANGYWIWATKDAPLITFGQGNIIAKMVEAPAHTNIVNAMIFNNLWHTNFVDNEMGEMDFSFDLKWQPETGEKIYVPDIANTLMSDPVLLLNPDKPADPLYQKYIFKP